jgi:hypothetical protein
LGPLQDNGGLTQTIALLAQSPAIDNGSAVVDGPTVPTTDQRGALRGTAGLDAGSRPDIGAYEASSSYLVNTSGSGSNVDTLAVAVHWANVSVNVNPANPPYAQPPIAGAVSAPNTILFSTSAFSSPQTINLTAQLELSNTTTPEAIDGSATAGVTISGENLFGVLKVDPGVTATLTGLTLSQGRSTNGGAIDNLGGLTVSNSTFSDDVATANGGAIDNEAGGTLVVLNSTLANNSATMGGGIFNSASATTTATDSTLAGNSANAGSAIYSAGTLTTVNATFAYNASVSGGGAIDAAAGTTTLYNTIVASNTSGTGMGATPSDVAGTVSGSSSFNLIGTGGSGGLTNGTNGNHVGVSNPGLGVLASNGGPTQTIALLSTSPAINGGSATIGSITIPLTDQRGTLRIPENTMIDVGAYQASANYQVTSTADTLVAGTLRSAINWANANSSSGVMDVISFDTSGVFATPQTITLSPSLPTLSLTNMTAPVAIEGPAAALLTISGAGGATGIFSIGPGATVTMTGITIAEGSASTLGNTPYLSGGAILNYGNLTIASDVFSNDSAILYGGAISNGGKLSITNTTFSGNSAAFGLGGSIDNSGTLSVDSSTFSGGTAWQGGAIDNKTVGVLFVSNSTFSDNSGTEGGAIFNDAFASIYGSTFANDVTTFDGGAIANDLAGKMFIVNSTIANNNAAQSGGGINTVGTLTITNSTIAYNSVNSGGAGGGIYATTGTATLNNTIVVLNTSGSGTTATANDISGAVSSQSAFNLIGIGGSGGLTTSKITGNQVGVTTPGLGLLANNGGPTQTIALLAGSPAIDAGSNALAVDTLGNPLAFDQRGPGFGRIVNSVVDIGAFERFLSTTSVLKSSVNPSTVGQTVVFTVTVSPSGSSTLTPTGTVTFFDGVLPLQTVTLVDGTASYSTSSLPIGINTISVVYSGDTNFATSTSTPITQTVNPVTVTAISVLPDPTIIAIVPQSSAVATQTVTAAISVGTASSPSPTTTVVAGPVGKAVKKAVGTKKALPHGGSSTKFHQSKKTATLKRTVAVVTNHAAQPSVKQGKPSVQLTKIGVKKK